MCKNSENNKIRPDWIIRNIQWLGWFLFGFTIICIAITIKYYLGHSNEGLGTTGDYFGGIINPTISFVALCGLIINLHVQRYEIEKIFQNKKIEKLEEIIKNLLKYYSIVQNDKSKIIETISKKEKINIFIIEESPPCKFRVAALVSMYFNEEESLKTNCKNLIESCQKLQLELLDIAKNYNTKNELKLTIEEMTKIHEKLAYLSKEISPHIQSLDKTCVELVKKLNS